MRVFVGPSLVHQDAVRRLAHWELMRPSLCRTGRMLICRLRSRGQSLTPSSELRSHTPLMERGFGLELAIRNSFPCVSLTLILQVTPGWVLVAAVGIAAARVSGAYIHSVLSCPCTQPEILHFMHT